MAVSAIPDGRSLTPGEVAMLRDVFGPRISYASVRVHPHPWFWPLPRDRSMSPNGSMYLSPRIYAPDLSAPTVPLYAKGVFVHEATHLYQWYVLGWPLWIAAPFDREYDYKLIAGKPFDKYGIEQMGMIAEHYYVLKHGGRPSDLPDKAYTAASYAALLPVR